MIDIEIEKILPLYPNRAYIDFKVEGVKKLNVPLPGLVFYLRRSETPHLEDSWEVVNPTGSPGSTEFYFVDEHVRLLGFFNQYYYQVYTTYQGKTYYSDVVSSTRNQRKDEFLRKRKILHDEEIVLKKFSGRKIAIVKRRHVGPRCPSCFDPNTGNVTRSHCRTCYGTGFVDPYYKPFITWGARLPVYKEVDELGNDHGNETDYSKYQILDYPSTNPQDLVIDLDVNDRYKVDRVEKTEMRRITVHQELVVTKLARTAIEYKWDFGKDLIDLPDSIEL